MDGLVLAAGRNNSGLVVVVVVVVVCVCGGGGFPIEPLPGSVSKITIAARTNHI
jgi:hypothetical protein